MIKPARGADHFNLEPKLVHHVDDVFDNDRGCDWNLFAKNLWRGK